MSYMLCGVREDPYSLHVRLQVACTNHEEEVAELKARIELLEGV